MRQRYGYKVRLNSDPRWLNVDGKMDDCEKNVNKEGAKWFVVKGPGDAGTFMVYIQGLERYGIGCNFTYLDDDKTPSPPEFESGQVPFVSFHAYGLENLKKGTIEFNALVYMFNKELPEEDTGNMAEILDNPTKITCLALKKQSISLLKMP